MMIISTRKKIIILLILIFISALILRVMGVFYHTYEDETFYVYKSFQIGRFNFINTYNLGVGVYILFLVNSVFYLFGNLFGSFNSISEFVGVYLTNPYPFFVVGRLAEALFGALSVFVIYTLGKEISSSRVGIAAAVLLAFNPIHIEISQIVRGQAISSFFLLLSFVYLWRIGVQDRFRNYIFFAIFAGLANTIRNYNIVIFLPFLIAHIKNCRDYKEKIFNFKLILTLLIFAGVYIIFVPDTILQIDQFLSYTIGQIINTAGGKTEVNYIGCEVRNAAVFYLRDGFPAALTWPVYITSLAAFLFCLYRIFKDYFSALLISFVGIYFLIITRSNIVSARYLLPVVPLLQLGVAIFLQKAMHRIRVSAASTRLLFPASILLLSIIPLVSIVKRDLVMLKPSTLWIGRQWILTNIPDGALVAADGMGGRTPDLKLSTVIDYNLYNMGEAELKAEIEKRDKEGLDSYALKYFYKNPPYPRYYIMNLGVRVPVPTEEIEKKGIKYLIINNGLRYMYYKPDIIEKYPGICRSRQEFYSWLKSDTTAIKSFAPAKNSRGTTFTIYKVVPKD